MPKLRGTSGRRWHRPCDASITVKKVGGAQATQARAADFRRPLAFRVYTEVRIHEESAVPQPSFLFAESCMPFPMGRLLGWV